MSRPAPGRNLLVAATVIVVATIGAALWVMDSPATQRERRLDQRRAQDLQEIVSLLAVRHEQGHGLPATLAALAAEPGVSLPKDPVSGAAYDYALLGPDRYRLCAVFATSTAGDGPAAPYAIRNDAWLHPAGRHCFERALETASRKP